MAEKPEEQKISDMDPSKDSTTHADKGITAASSQKGTKDTVYRKFTQVYAGTFSKNFDSFMADATPATQTGSGPPITGADLYNLLFTQGRGQGQEELIRSTYRNIIHYTFDADAILSRTFLTMIRDLAGYLAKNRGIISDLHPLTARINELAGILFFVYFKISKIRASITKEETIEESSNKGILESFKTYLSEENIAEEECELKIHTYYRGIPVELDASVLTVDEASVTFSIHPYEAVALSKLGMAFLYSSLHGTSFKAYTKNVDIKERTATFSRFIPHDHLSERRAHIRVEPDDYIKAKIVLDRIEISAIVYDLSEVAFALYVRNIDPDMFSPGTSVQLVTELPLMLNDGTASIHTDCTVLKLYKKTKGDPHAHRVVLQMEDSQHLTRTLLQYISKRQIEILQELKKLSEEEG